MKAMATGVGRAWEFSAIFGGQTSMFTRCICALVLVFFSLNHCCQSQENPAPTSIEVALGIQESLDQLSALNQQGQGGSTAAISLRQDILVKIMRGSFACDSVLARIQVEIAYTEETRILLEGRGQRREARYALASFLAGGVSGAAGSAMSLTSSLSHTGTVVGLVGGGSVLALALVHASTSGPKQAVQSPLNMLAQILGVPPNSKSGYPPVVLALISVPGPEGGMYVSRLPTLWRQLNRLQVDEHSKKGSSLQSVTCDADKHMQTTAGELSDREAMLQDLNAALLALRSRLGGLLDQVQAH